MEAVVFNPQAFFVYFHLPPVLDISPEELDAAVHKIVQLVGQMMRLKFADIRYIACDYMGRFPENQCYDGSRPEKKRMLNIGRIFFEFPASLQLVGTLSEPYKRDIAQLAMRVLKLKSVCIHIISTECTAMYCFKDANLNEQPNSSAPAVDEVESKDNDLICA